MSKNLMASLAKLITDQVEMFLVPVMLRLFNVANKFSLKAFASCSDSCF